MYEDVGRSLRSGACVHPAFDRQVEGLIDRHVAMGLQAEDRGDPMPMDGHRCRYTIFKRAEAFMLDHLHKEIYISELCEAAMVSERTLRYAFGQVIGLSPTRYLFYLRLSSSCRDLMLAHPDRVSVASIALKRGMWDLSRFAGGYHRVFGEYPSETLRRRLAAIA